MAELNSRQDYIDAGVEPPSIESHGTTPEAIRAHVDDHIHYWQARGNDMFCDRGEHIHGHHIPANHILIGTSPLGEPQFKVIDNDSLPAHHIIDGELWEEIVDNRHLL